MIRKEDTVEIGKFLKTHALKGELNVMLDVETEFLTDGNPVIVEIDGILVPFYADTVRPKGSESALVKLSGVDSQEMAQKFVNKPIYGLRENLVDYFDDPDMELKADFIGFRIVDSNLGDIGIVVDVDDSTANVLFIVEASDGRIIYIPVAEEFINAIDDEREVIEMTLPEGLLDIN